MVGGAMLMQEHENGFLVLVNIHSFLGSAQPASIYRNVCPLVS